MGTLGCINDMLQRDKENRALRKRNRERLAETRNRLLEIGRETGCTNLSVEQLEDIRRKTLEKEERDKAAGFKAMLCLAGGVALVLLLVWLLVGCSGRPSGSSYGSSAGSLSGSSSENPFGSSSGSSFGNPSGNPSGNNQSEVKSDSALIPKGRQPVSVLVQDASCPLSVAAQCVKDSVYTEQELKMSQQELPKIQQELRERYARSEIKGTRLDGNVSGWGIQGNHLVVHLCLNSPEARAVFRKKVMDSPAIRFEGLFEPAPDHQRYTADTLGIRLYPECPAYPYTAPTATFVLLNQSRHELECGDPYRITYEDKQGVWRVLPIHTTFNSIAYVIQPGESFRFKAHLNPNVLPNQPGRYRFFYEVRLVDTNQVIKLMTEFRLADSTDIQTPSRTSSIRWGHLADETEGVIQVRWDDRTHQEIKSRTKEVSILSSYLPNSLSSSLSSSLSNSSSNSSSSSLSSSPSSSLSSSPSSSLSSSVSDDKVYVSVFSPTHSLTYKGEYVFYREDQHKTLHEIQGEHTNKESVAFQVERGKEAEIGIDLPKNAQPGDYLLKIRVYDEDEKGYYILRQWFEAYTSKQVSTRERPIFVGPDPGSKPQVLPGEEEVFDVVRHMPEFPGGLPRLMEFIRQHLQYPPAARQSRLEGRVIIQVVIDTDGTVTRPRILRSVRPGLCADTALCEEALRVVSMMPKWKPGHQHGVNLKVRYAFPVTFELPDKEHD